MPARLVSVKKSLGEFEFSSPTYYWFKCAFEEACVASMPLLAEPFFLLGGKGGVDSRNDSSDEHAVDHRRPAGHGDDSHA